MRGGRARLVAAVVAALLAFGWVCLAAGGAAARVSCWRQVLDDWHARDLGTYPVHCYREALRLMPEDLAVYSSAEEDIGRALARRIARRPAAVRSASRVLSEPAAGGSRDVWSVVALGAGGVLVVAATPFAVARLRGRRRR